MSNNLTIHEEISFCTVLIHCIDKNGNESSGTGFYYMLKSDENSFYPILVTNKHVIEGAEIGILSFNIQNDDGSPSSKIYKLRINNFESQWRLHPDENVDLCFIPMAGIINHCANNGNPIFIRTIPKKYIPSSEDIADFDNVENVIMVGYPNGIKDSVNNKPIFRRGITATDLKVDYNGDKIFLIDLAVFPGSSGSPIFIADKDTYSSKSGLNIGKSRYFFVGIVYAVFQQTAIGEIIEVPINQYKVSTSIPINLGLVIKSSRLFDFESFL